MPLMHGNGGVSCGDCYFRQELLCALQVEKVCPTFRATVGQAPKRPMQAQLVPVPALVREDPAGEPFSSGSPEATFSVREAARGNQAGIVTAAEAASPRPALRAAAARRERINEVVVPVDEPDVERFSSRRGGGSTRSSRVAERIAQRYPRALASC